MEKGYVDDVSRKGFLSTSSTQVAAAATWATREITSARTKNIPAEKLGEGAVRRAGSGGWWGRAGGEWAHPAKPAEMPA